ELQGDYEKALEALCVLEELGRSDEKSRAYLEGLRDIKNGLAPKSNSRYFKRLALQDAILENRDIALLVKSVDAKTALDLLWFCQKEYDGALKEMIFEAKNGGNIDENAPFALKVMSQITPKIKSDLRFSYKCEICGHEDTLFFGRCPKCKNADSCFVDASIVQKTNFESAMFT
ncbi:MAG: hypothetical protein RL154_518, partial [Pseudomonadota bacterium]